MARENRAPYAVLVLSHGDLASELLRTARRIAGEFEGAEALDLDWDWPPEEIQRRVRDRIETLLSEHEGVLVLADLFGSTPTRAALDAAEPGRVEVVAGINLPMILRLACHGEGSSDLRATARRLAERGRDSIFSVASSAAHLSKVPDPCSEDPS